MTMNLFILVIDNIYCDKTCDEGEIFVKAGFDCATCDNYQVVKCALINKPGCYCGAGFVRDGDGKCVATATCP